MKKYWKVENLFKKKKNLNKNIEFFQLPWWSSMLVTVIEYYGEIWCLVRGTSVCRYVIVCVCVSVCWIFFSFFFVVFYLLSWFFTIILYLIRVNVVAVVAVVAVVVALDCWWWWWCWWCQKPMMMDQPTKHHQHHHHHHEYHYKYYTYVTKQMKEMNNTRKENFFWPLSIVVVHLPLLFLLINFHSQFNSIRCACLNGDGLNINTNKIGYSVAVSFTNRRFSNIIYRIHVVCVCVSVYVPKSANCGLLFFSDFFSLFFFHFGVIGFDAVE